MAEANQPPPAPHREQLIFLLTEAAELEHGLMCSYLFASFSLRGRGENLQADESACVASWRASIHAVAVEEMLHLALVQNLLTSIGGAPHLQRPNFPVSAGLYPSDIALQLRRFDEATLDHFIFLERPEGVDLPDGAGFGPAQDYVRGTPKTVRLMASAQEYESVAALYRGIEDGFEALAAQMGEAALFIGDAQTQVGPELLALEGLHPVVDLDSARAAVRRIIEQGEGGRRAHEASHYDRFLQIRKDLAARKATRPSFDPAYPVAANPVMHRPADPAAGTYVSAPDAAHVLDIGNTAYGLMIQLLARFFAATDPPASRRVLADVAIALMAKVIAPVAQLLATLPARTDDHDEHAGLAFTLPRSTHALPQRRAAWTILHERALQLAASCASSSMRGELAAIGHHVEVLAERLRSEWHASPPTSTVSLVRA